MVVDATPAVAPYGDAEDPGDPGVLDTVDGPDGHLRHPMDEGEEGDTDMDEAPASLARMEENARRRMEASARKSFANVGILESIRVENFMCHRNFEFTFGPSMNVINGQNGSGKSAIVAALQIGFGVQASQTERGKRLSEHIMHGETNALISIRIRNRPPLQGEVDERYRPHDYGDAIVIERKITRDAPGRSGTQQWIFRNAHGKKVEPADKPRVELDAIMDTFSIYVDNPIAVLTQQKSKQFLNQGKPSGLYNFFKHATMLNLWEQDLLKVRAQIDDLRALLAQKKYSVSKISKELDRLEQRFNRAKAVDEHAANLNILKERYAWAIVAELENEVAKVEDKLASKQVKMDEYVEELGLLNKKVEHETAVHKDKSNLLDELTQKISDQQQELDDLQQAVRLCKRKAGMVQNSLANERRLTSEAARNADNAVKDLTAERAKHKDTTGKRANVENRIAQSQLEAEHIRDEIERCKVRRDIVDKSVIKFREEAEVFKRNEESLESRIRTIEMELQNSTNQGSVRRFGNHVPNILEKIEKYVDQFHRKPIGPIGQHISISNECWAIAVEAAIGDLSVFLVHDSHDENILRQMGQRKLITASFDIPAYQISDESRSPLRTVLDVISTPSKEVFNALVDQSEIERIVLCGDKNEMDKVAYDNSVPNMKMCFIPDGSRAFVKFGSRSFVPAGRRPQVPKLQKDISDIVDRCKMDMERCQDEKAMLIEKRRQWDSERMLKTDEQTALHKQEQDLQRRKQQTARELEKLSYELDAASGGFESSAWDERIREEKEKEESHRKRAMEIETELDEAKQALMMAETKKDAQTSVGGGTIYQQSGKIREELTSILSGIKKQKVRIKTIEARIVPIQNEIAGLMQDVADGQRTVEEDTIAAKKLHAERIEVEKSSKDIQTEMDTMTGQIEIQRQKNSGLTREDAEKDYLRATARKKENDKLLKDCERNLKSVKEGFRGRKKRYNKMKRMLRAETSVMFGHYLGKRKHTGSLSFDDDTETLDITVSMSHAMTDAGERVETKDLKALSGGEKSFTTLSFMLALGEQMHIPFRIMDEFDVFMDEANRRASWESLVQVARDSPGRQFIYITPLEMPQLPGVGGERLRVQKLAPPSRNQRTLDEVGVSKE